MQELKKILLVEDEADIQEIARLSLEVYGKYVVEVCNSGKEAIEKAPKVLPDLIILDVMMPGMDGITTLNELNKIHQVCDIPVIFMTAKAQSNETRQYLECGAIGVISKPFDPINLANEIRDIWQNRL